MTDESVNISAKSRARALEPINKLGYMDGAADGQNASFQTSFNTAYEQGFSFGMELAFNEALAQHNKQSIPSNIQDPRRINCQMCITGTGAQENIIPFVIYKARTADAIYVKVMSNDILNMDMTTVGLKKRTWLQNS